MSRKKYEFNPDVIDISDFFWYMKNPTIVNLISLIEKSAQFKLAKTPINELPYVLADFQEFMGELSDKIEREIRKQDYENNNG